MLAMMGQSNEWGHMQETWIRGGVVHAGSPVVGKHLVFLFFLFRWEDGDLRGMNHEKTM